MPRSMKFCCGCTGVNSLIPGRCGCDFKCVKFQTQLGVWYLDYTSKYYTGMISFTVSQPCRMGHGQHLILKWIWIEVMTWCCQSTSHYPSQCRHMASLGHDEFLLYEPTNLLMAFFVLSFTITWVNCHIILYASQFFYVPGQVKPASRAIGLWQNLDMLSPLLFSYQWINYWDIRVPYFSLYFMLINHY